MMQTEQGQEQEQGKARSDPNRGLNWGVFFIQVALQ